MERISDKLALDAIFSVMNGVEWNSDLWDVVASIIRASGRGPFLSPGEDA